MDTEMNEDSSAFINVEASEYNQLGDTTYYDHHSFTLTIWSQKESLHYQLQRNILSFCDLHARLSKKFQKSTFPDFPFGEALIVYMKHMQTSSSSASKFMKRMSSFKGASDQGNDQISSQNGNDLRASIFAIDDGTDASGGTRVDGSSQQKPNNLKITSEIFESDPAIYFSKLKLVVTEYIRNLFKMPEILISEDLKLFLDEEANQGLSLTRKTLTDIDVALVGEEPTIVTVSSSKEHCVNFSGTAGDVVVWSFATKKKDIGFSVLSGKNSTRGGDDSHSDDHPNPNDVLVPYQRYNSDKHTVSGCVQLTKDQTVLLVWDNSYSKFRSKTLVLVANLTKQEDFEVAQKIAEAKSRDRHRFEQQRVVLSRALNAALTLTLQATGGAMARMNLKSSSATTVGGMEEEVVILREDLLRSRASLTQLDTALVEARAMNDEISENLNKEKLMREQADMKIEKLEDDNQNLKNLMNDLSVTQIRLTQAIDNMKKIFKEKEISLQQYEDNQKKDITIRNELNHQLTKNKADKKQLKAYALQIKADYELREREITELQVEMEKLRHQLSEPNERNKSAPKPIEKDNDEDTPSAAHRSPSTVSKGKAKVVSVGWEVPRAYSEEPTAFSWESDPIDEIGRGMGLLGGGDMEIQDGEAKDAMCAYILNQPFPQRLLYNYNSTGF
jgi:hypothetical protein